MLLYPVGDKYGLMSEIKLRDVWASSLKERDNDVGTRIDILPGLSSMALDVIGMAGMMFLLIASEIPY